MTSVKKPETPVVFRLNCLRKIVNDPVYSRQKENITAAIRMYENGKLPELQSTWFANGKVLASWPTSVEKGFALWNEVRLKIILSFHVHSLLHTQGIHYQMTHHETIPLVPAAPPALQSPP